MLLLWHELYFVLSVTVRDYKQQYAGSSSGIYYAISFEVYEHHLHRQCATVLLQDAMPGVLINTCPETQPTQYYQSCRLGQSISLALQKQKETSQDAHVNANIQSYLVSSVDAQTCQCN